MLVPAHIATTHREHRTSYAADARTRPMGSGLELCAMRKDGTEVPVEISLSPFDHGDRPRVIAAVRDITERKDAQARFRAAFADAPIGMSLVEVTPNGGRTILEANAAMGALLGCSRMRWWGSRSGTSPIQTTARSTTARRSRSGSATRSGTQPASGTSARTAPWLGSTCTPQRLVNKATTCWPSHTPSMSRLRWRPKPPLAESAPLQALSPRCAAQCSKVQVGRLDSSLSVGVRSIRSEPRQRWCSSRPATVTNSPSKPP